MLGMWSFKCLLPLIGSIEGLNTGSMEHFLLFQRRGMT